jgi:DNA-binding SARP family transcriptional activator
VASDNDGSSETTDVNGVEVSVLGPVAIVGWLAVPTRRILIELLCYLALHHDRPVHGEELRAALWPSEDGVEASAKSLRTYMSLLRQYLGPELVPEATRGTGYRLSRNVTTDWAAFQEHVALADRSTEEFAQADALRSALALVRGMPFAGVASGTFMWAWSVEMLASTMEVAIVEAARRLVNLSLASGDGQTAMWATMRGLIASPYDNQLWKHHLMGARWEGGLAGLERAWANLISVFGQPPPDLIELRHDLARNVTGWHMTAS